MNSLDLMTMNRWIMNKENSFFGNLLFENVPFECVDIYYIDEGYPRTIHDEFGADAALCFQFDMKKEIEKRNDTRKIKIVNTAVFAAEHKEKNVGEFVVDFQGIKQRINRKTFQFETQKSEENSERETFAAEENCLDVNANSLTRLTTELLSGVCTKETFDFYFVEDDMLTNEQRNRILQIITQKNCTENVLFVLRNAFAVKHADTNIGSFVVDYGDSKAIALKKTVTVTCLG